MGNKARWLALLAVLMAGAAQAEALVRVRAIEILPNAKSDPVGGVDVANKLAPDIDLSWFFTKNIAVELLLTIPQTHQVTLNGADIGNAAHLPPTLLLQYHAPLSPRFQPYVGAGLNYTVFTDRDLNGGLQLERDSVGPALQVGFDVPIQDGWLLNFDVKKIWIGSDVTAAGSFVTHVDIDPLVVGAGIGYRF